MVAQTAVNTYVFRDAMQDFKEQMHLTRNVIQKKTSGFYECVNQLQKFCVVILVRPALKSAWHSELAASRFTEV